MNALSLLHKAEQSGVAPHEARILLQHATGMTLARLLTSTPRQDEQRVFLSMVDERLAGRPLQYILGEWEFLGLPFFVDERVLIPRPETELLVRQAMTAEGVGGCRSALDLCTGSGCIAVCLARFTDMRVCAADISTDALCVAKQNAARHCADIEFVQANLLDGLGVYDIITSNPPYIRQGDMDTLQKELRFEPALALVGGEDGLCFYRTITREAGAHLHPGGRLLLEVGKGQSAEVSALLSEAGFTRVECVKDENDIERVVMGSVAQ